MEHLLIDRRGKGNLKDSKVASASNVTTKPAVIQQQSRRAESYMVVDHVLLQIEADLEVVAKQPNWAPFAPEFVALERLQQCYCSRRGAHSGSRSFGSRVWGRSGRHSAGEQLARERDARNEESFTSLPPFKASGLPPPEALLLECHAG